MQAFLGETQRGLHERDPMKRIALIAATVAAMFIAGTVQTTEAATTTSTFKHPNFVASFMVNYLNDDPSYSGVRTTSVSRWRIVIKGRYEGYLPFTAHLTKATRQTIRIRIFAMGESMSDTVAVGFDI